MRIGNAYRIVEELRKNDKRYNRLISRIESKIEYEIRLSVGSFKAPNIDFNVRTNLKLSKGEMKAIRTYLNDKYFSYTREYKLSMKYRKRLFGQTYYLKLI